MCGICGIVDLRGPAIDARLVEKMTDTLRHRGPDDSGIAALGPAGLGQRRLAIIDLSPAGHQPMTSPDGRYTIIYNGELYNYQSIQARLLKERPKLKLRGRSDTEVLLHAFIQWGEAVFPMCNGMYALAVWDRDQQVLTLARDRFGIKPMYFHRLPGGIVFGSEIKALLASGHISRSISWPALHEYMYFGNALGQRTMFEGIERLLPGHTLRLDKHGISTKSFWSPERLQEVGDDLDAATDHVRERLDKAVQSHLISDVPVGVFLSGGIDSSAITAFASKHYKGNLKTYSVHFDFDPIDEQPKARLVAEKFGTTHQELFVRAGNMQEIIERLVHCHDEPFADAADIPLYLLCQQLAGSVKVILQGDGGDEIFAGYRRYNILAHERFWRVTSNLARFGRSLIPNGPRRQRAMRFFETMNIADPSLRLAMLMTVETLRAPPTRLLSAEAKAHLERHDPFQRYRDIWRRFEGLDPVQRNLYIDSLILLPDTFLEKVDKSTMAHSIEVRVPFLDTNLTDYAMALPSKFKVRNRQKKFILRRALRGVVPDEILDGPKTGLGVPVAEWLRKPLADYARGVLLDSSNDGLIDRTATQTALQEHIDGRANHWFVLYKLLLLSLWRRFYGITA